jgi:hypothetical protein
VIAYKFLAPGSISPFTGFRWPGAGVWVSAPAGSDTWVRACRRGDLPHWLDEELWRIELEEPVLEGRYQIASPSARLVARVVAWHDALRLEYAEACALRARDLALPHLPPALRGALRDEGDLRVLEGAKDAAGPSSAAAGYLSDAARVALRARPAAASYVACTLAATIGGLPAFEAERAWQARWLAERLALEPATRAGGASSRGP